MFKTLCRQSSLRFRQWSRKAYAAFKSIGRHVIIGSIKNIVADALLGKQKGSGEIVNIVWHERFCVSKDHSDDIYPDEQQYNPDIIMLMPFQNNSKPQGRAVFSEQIKLNQILAESVECKTLSAFFITTPA